MQAWRPETPTTHGGDGADRGLRERALRRDQGGVNALTKAAAVEVARDNISVNALAFAAIDIPGDMIWRFLDSQGIPPDQLVSMFPIGRMGRSEKFVASVRYLCSDDPSPPVAEPELIALLVGVVGDMGCVPTAITS